MRGVCAACARRAAGKVVTPPGSGAAELCPPCTPWSGLEVKGRKGKNQGKGKRATEGKGEGRKGTEEKGKGRDSWQFRGIGQPGSKESQESQES